MKWKTTLLLLLLTVGVGAYVSLHELKQPTPEERSRLANRVVNLNPEEVTGLLVTAPKGTVTLQRISNVWQVVSPRRLRAEAPLVSRILNHLNPLEAEHVLRQTTERPLAPADYGLQSPAATLTVITADRTMKLLFGDATAVGANRYLSMEGTPVLYVVSASLVELLVQPLDAFRSHDLVDVTAEEIQRITVVSPSSSYTLARTSEPASATHADRWRLTHPVDDPADSGVASTIVSALRGLRAERFLTDEFTEGDLARFGLAAPYATITIAVTEGDPPLELVIGKVTEDNDQRRTAKRSDEPTVFAVASAKVEELLRDPQELRSRACFDFFASQVAKLQVSWEGAPWTIERQQKTWKASDGTELDDAEVEEFLWKIRDITLTRFVEDAPQDLARYGLDPAKGTIRVWLTGQSDPQGLSVGETIDGGATRYGWMSGRAEVVELPESLNEILTATPEALKAVMPSASE